MTENATFLSKAVGASSKAYTSTSSDNSRFSVYTLPTGPKVPDLEASNKELTLRYVQNVLGDPAMEDCHQILTTIPFVLTTIRECVDHHFGTLDEIFLNGHEDRDIQLYPYGIVVFDPPTSALLIHCDQIRKNELESLRFGDIEFGDLCNNYGVRIPQNDPEIDPHYAEHKRDDTGQWRHNSPMFAVFSTGMREALPVLEMLDDEHYDMPYGHGRCDIFGLGGSRYLEGWEDVRACFPKVVRDYWKEGKWRHLGERPCRECRPLHSRLFICVDNPEPRERGVMVCRMEWNGDVEGKSEELLKEIGRGAHVESRRVGVAFALALAGSMAAEERDDKEGV